MHSKTILKPISISYGTSSTQRTVIEMFSLLAVQGGTYLVRDSKGSGQPYTLGIFYNGDIFNISIRKRPDGKFALGKEKPEEHVRMQFL